MAADTPTAADGVVLIVGDVELSDDDGGVDAVDESVVLDSGVGEWSDGVVVSRVVTSVELVGAVGVVGVVGTVGDDVMSVVVSGWYPSRRGTNFMGAG